LSNKNDKISESKNDYFRFRVWDKRVPLPVRHSDLTEPISNAPFQGYLIDGGFGRPWHHGRGDTGGGNRRNTSIPRVKTGITPLIDTPHSARIDLFCHVAGV